MLCSGIAERALRVAGAFTIAKTHCQVDRFVDALVAKSITFCKCVPMGREGRVLAQAVSQEQTTPNIARAFGAAIKKARVKGRAAMTRQIAAILATGSGYEYLEGVALNLELAYAWNIAQDAGVTSAMAQACNKVRHFLELRVG
jgi:thiazole synthase ThiGH ThiG subunit